jgi:hypothetical protein
VIRDGLRVTLIGGAEIELIFAALDQHRDTVQVRHLIEAGRSLQDAFIEAVS